MSLTRREVKLHSKKLGDFRFSLVSVLESIQKVKVYLINKISDTVQKKAFLN